MTAITYNATNHRFFLATLLISFVTAMGVVQFGSIPVLGLFVLIYMTVLFYHHPLFLVLMWPIFLCFDLLSPNGSLYTSGFTFRPMDPVYFFTFLYIAIHIVTRWHSCVISIKENFFLSIFILILLCYVVVDSFTYGKSALGEARKFFFVFFFPIIAYLVIRKFEEIRWILFGIFFVAVFAAILAYINLISGIWMEKILHAEGTLILLLTTFAIIILQMNGILIVNRYIDVSMLVFLSIIIIITMHRSIYLAAACGLSLLFLLSRNRINFRIKFVFCSITAVLLVSIVVLTIPKFDQAITNAVRGIIDPYSDRNASWRIRGWQQHLDKVWKINIFFGEGLGNYYSRFEGNREIKASPHNGYIHLILKFGLFGLLVYGVLVCMFFRKLLAVRRKLPLGLPRAYVEMGLLNFGAAQAYLLGYGFEAIMFIFFALGMVAVKMQQYAGNIP